MVEFMEFEFFEQNVCKQIICPHCNGTIKFYNYSGMGNLTPHFYCDSCSNILFRESDRKKLEDNEVTEQLLVEISNDLPGCPCGGKFKAGSNPKCPHCGKEIEHQGTPLTRLNDPYAIQIKGALLLKPKK